MLTSSDGLDSSAIRKNLPGLVQVCLAAVEWDVEVLAALATVLNQGPSRTMTYRARVWKTTARRWNAMYDAGAWRELWPLVRSAVSALWSAIAIRVFEMTLPARARHAERVLAYLRIDG